MSKNKKSKDKKPKSIGKLFLKISAWLGSITVVFMVSVFLIGFSAWASKKNTHLNVTDSHGNIQWNNPNTWKEYWDEGWDTIKGNFTQFGNHFNSSGWGTNADTLNKWSKQKGKLSSSQLHGNGTGNGSKVEDKGLYNYAKSLNIDPKAYKSDTALLKAVTDYVNKKNKQTDNAGQQNKDKWGRANKQASQEKSAWNKYTSNLLDAQKSLTSSAAKKVNAYLAKYGGTKGSDKWYKALDAALNKYATGTAKDKAQKADKTYKEDYAESAQGDKKTTAEDVEKMLAKGEMPTPTTLWGKIGRALMNAFWSSSIGSWLEKNGAGASIFAGETSSSQLATDIQSNPLTLIYPVSSDYSSMEQVSNWLQPAMIALGTALITIALVISTMRMGYGQVIDPVRSRVRWYQNIVDTLIAVVGVAAFPTFVNMVLQIDGGFLLGFAKFMESVTPSGANESIFQTALKLGFDKTTINAVSSGMLLGGSDFAGVIFEIIYLLAYISLAVYVKYYYFVRAIAFTVLVSIGPVFMSLWSLDWSKSRTVAWLRDFCGTVFIQCIHALTITFMAMFMDWNNGRITGETSQQIANMINWQKSNPGKQFLNSITLGLAGQGPSQTSSGASVFEVLVVGFIIVILFHPLSKSLAELFGISTNMLDNIHQSTSRTLKAGAMVGGAALGAVAMAPAGLALGATKGALGAAKDGVKAAAKGANTLKDFKDNMKSGFGSDFKNSLAKRKPLRSSLAKMNGIVGPGAGRLMGLAAGSGLDDPAAMLAASAAGGAIGERAAKLANKPLAVLGLRQLRKAKNAFTTKPNSELATDKVNQANAKTGQSLADQNKAIKDADNGHSAIDKNIDNINAKEQAIKDAYAKGNISADEKSSKLSELREQKRHLQDMSKDGELATRMAQADARKQTDGSYSNASKLAKVSKEALGSEASKMNSEAGQADQFQKSLATAGAATTGAEKSRFDGDAINNAANAAKIKYAQLNSDKFAQNGYSDQDTWIKSAQYRQGEAAAMTAARQEAAIHSDGKVFTMPDQTDNSAFGSSMVNKEIYKNDLSQRMQAAGVSNTAQRAVMSAINRVPGQALVSKTNIEGSDVPLQTLNYGLNDQLNKQAAYSINNAGNSKENVKPISAYDLGQVYKEDANPSTMIGGNAKEPFTAEGFKNYLNNAQANERLENVRSSLADTYADYQRNQADLNNDYDRFAAASNALSTRNIFGSFGRGGSSRTSNPMGYGNASEVTPNDYIASTRIADFNKTWGPSGISPQAAIDELSSNVITDDTNYTSGSGISAGDLQLVTSNNGSYVRAKMGDGSYQLVGNYGEGDPGLIGGDSIIQNLDVSPDGTIGPKFDNNTHRVEQPFSQVGDYKVSRAYSNGGPDLSQMLGGFSAPTQASNVDMSDYRTMRQAPELERSNYDSTPITLDKLGDNYSDYKYYSDGNEGVIVGKDKRDGLYKQVSDVTSDSILGTHSSGQQYSIPLVDTGNGLSPDISRDPMIFSRDPLTKQSEREIRDTLRTHVDNSNQRLEFNFYLNDMLHPTEQNLHNYTATHPAHQSIDGLDFTSL